MNVEPAATNQMVTGAIRQAARMTGADFKYLLATAQVESNLNPNAQASTSSARGLFQFTEQTWLTTLKEQGTALGYGPYAKAISRQPLGDYAVSDPRLTDAILNLRSDPTANALMAGAFTKVNAAKLAGRLGRGASEGELYIAHFLGPTGASRLIGLADTSPRTPAAAILPSAARANPSIFYDGRGNARSAGDVYRTLIGRYDVARGGPANVPVVAANTGEKAPPLRNAFAHDTAAVTGTYAAAAPPSLPADAGLVFHGLFRSNGGEAVAPVVSSLWTSPPPGQAVPPGQAAAASHVTPAIPAAAMVGPEPAAPPMGSGELSLFQDRLPDARSLFRGRV